MIKIFVKRKKRKKEFLVFLPSIKIIFKSLAHSLAQHPSPPHEASRSSSLLVE